MTHEDQQKWHLDDALEKINALKILPEAQFILPMLERLERRLEDRGVVTSFFANQFTPETVQDLIRESYADHGHQPPANDCKDTLSRRLTKGLNELTKSLEPLVKEANYVTQGMMLSLVSEFTVDMMKTGNGPLSKVLNHTHEIESLDSSHSAFDRERGHKYLSDLGIEVPPLPRGSAELIPLVEKDLAKLEAFRDTLNNPHNKKALSTLIGCYQNILGVVRSPDTVVPIGSKRNYEPERYLASLTHINQQMRGPFLTLFQEYHDEPEYIDPSFSIHANTLDLIKDYILERNNGQPTNRVDSHGRDAQGITTPPHSPSPTTER